MKTATFSSACSSGQNFSFTLNIVPLQPTQQQTDSESVYREFVKVSLCEGNWRELQPLECRRRTRSTPPCRLCKHVHHTMAHAGSNLLTYSTCLQLNVHLPTFPQPQGCIEDALNMSWVITDRVCTSILPVRKVAQSKLQSWQKGRSHRA